MKILTLLCLITLSLAQFQAVKISKKLQIDGKIESDWMSGIKINKFMQYDPNFNIPSTKKTEAYFLYDEENIYISAKIYQDQSTIKSNRYRRDANELFSGDWFQVNLDPFNKGYSGYYVAINPSNAIIDGKVGASGQEDKSYDFIFHSEVKTYRDHWEVEIQIPLDGIDFQNKEIQTWGFTFARHYADNSERMASHKMIKEDMFRMSRYHKAEGLTGLKKEHPFSFVPYQYYSEVNDKLINKNSSDGKVGYELKFQPNSETTWFMTVNPDFAQIETDAEVINVSDQPTSYPEKRPFFTFTSDMYGPASAVRTRNIGDIDAGIKLIKEVGFLKYDVTAVLDKQQNRTLLTDIRYTDVKNYSVEFIAGARKSKTVFSSNTVLNTEHFFLNKTLTLWQYIEYSANDGLLNIFQHGRQKYSLESKGQFGWLKGLRYRTRELSASISHDYKNEDYNPAEVAVWLQSNISNTSGKISYNFYFENSFFVSVRSEIQFENNGLASHNGEDDTEYVFELSSRFRPSTVLGIWNIGVKLNPNSGQRFRYRGDKLTHKYHDTYSAFSLVKQGHTDINFWWGTDRSKVLSTNGWGWAGSTRNAPTTQFENTVSMRPTSDILLEYRINYINVEGSYYTKKVNQFIHRLKAEYNLTDKLNIRGIYQFNFKNEELLNYLNKELYLSKSSHKMEKEPTLNITSSWEYSPGSYVYLVLNKNKNRSSKKGGLLLTSTNANSIIFKVNKTFQF